MFNGEKKLGRKPNKGVLLVQDTQIVRFGWYVVRKSCVVKEGGGGPE